MVSIYWLSIITKENMSFDCKNAQEGKIRSSSAKLAVRKEWRLKTSMTKLPMF